MTQVIDFQKAKDRITSEKASVVANDNNSPNVADFSIDFSLMVARDILSFLEEIGYELTVDENLIYDIMLLIESNKAMIYRLHGEQHSMHSVSEQIFEIENPYKTLEEILDDLLTE
jgi:hypothetical protein